MFQNKEKIMNNTIMPRIIIGLTALLMSSTVLAEAKSFTVKPYEAPAKSAAKAVAPERMKPLQHQMKLQKQKPLKNQQAKRIQNKKAILGY
jgi:hypothetical protein